MHAVDPNEFSKEGGAARIRLQIAPVSNRHWGRQAARKVVQKSVGGAECCGECVREKRGLSCSQPENSVDYNDMQNIAVKSAVGKGILQA